MTCFTWACIQPCVSVKNWRPSSLLSAPSRTARATRRRMRGIKGSSNSSQVWEPRSSRGPQQIPVPVPPPPPRPPVLGSLLPLTSNWDPKALFSIASRCCATLLAWLTSLHTLVSRFKLNLGWVGDRKEPPRDPRTLTKSSVHLSDGVLLPVSWDPGVPAFVDDPIWQRTFVAVLKAARLFFSGLNQRTEIGY